MGLETYFKPNVSEELAIELAWRLYGLEVLSINRMVSFDDQNFHIKVSEKYQNPFISQVLDGGYNLKITNANRSAIADHFDSMHAAMIHLSEKDLSVPVPVKTVEGRTWKLEKVPLLNEENADGDKLCGIHLLTYLPGVPISKVPYTSDVLYQWGQMLAKYHHAVEDFHRPSLLKKQFLWKLEYVSDIRSYMDAIQDDAKAKLVISVLDKYPEQIVKNMEKLPKGSIHGDFNENNILVESTDEGYYLVDGILDFEDIHHGTYVWDLGVTLAYTLLDCKTMDPLDGAGHALAGYLSLRKLNELELSLVKMCIQCRLCQSLVLCMHSYRSDPTNLYLLTSSKTGWDRLEQICNITDEDLLQKWRKIQEQHGVKISPQ